MQKILNKLPFVHHRWFLYLRLLFGHFLDDNCTQKASSLTYTTLLSVVPMITVLLVVFSSVPALTQIKGQLQNALYSNLLPSSSTQVAQYLHEFAQKSSNVTTIGVLMLFVTTIMTLITIETAFNQIWRVQNRTGGIKSIVRYWTMITLGPIILGVAFTASSAIKSIDFLNQKIGGYGIDWAIYAQGVSVLITVAGFVGMYWFIPKVNVPIKNAVIAGVIAAFLFECVKRVFGFAITNFTSYEAIYGAFAALPIFLLWVYVSWNLILLGVEISYTLTIFNTKEAPNNHPLLSLLSMLSLIYYNYQNGKPTSEQALRDSLSGQQLPKWHLYLSQLSNHDLVIKTENDEYTLKKDLNTISFWQFYKTLPYPLPTKDELDQPMYLKHGHWINKLQLPLTKIEQQTKDAFDMSLADLFATSTPTQQRVVSDVGVQADDMRGVGVGVSLNQNTTTTNQTTQLLKKWGSRIKLVKKFMKKK